MVNGVAAWLVLAGAKMDKVSAQRSNGATPCVRTPYIYIFLANYRVLPLKSASGPVVETFCSYSNVHKSCQQEIQGVIW